MRYFFVMICLGSLFFFLPVSWAKETGEELYSEKKYDKALEGFLKKKVDRPDDPTITYNIGNTYYKLGDYKAAEHSYLDAALSSEGSGLQQQAYYNLGNSLFRQGKLEEAIDYYKKSLELNPDDQDAKYNLEFVKQEIKKRKEKQQQKDEKGDKQEKNEDQEKSDESKDGSENSEQEKEDQSTDKEQDEQNQSASQKGGNESANEEKNEDEGAMQKTAMQEEKMTDQEAQRWLDSLQEERGRYVRQEMKKRRKRSSGSGKDW